MEVYRRKGREGGISRVPEIITPDGYGWESRDKEGIKSFQSFLPNPFLSVEEGKSHEGIKSVFILHINPSSHIHPPTRNQIFLLLYVFLPSLLLRFVATYRCRRFLDLSQENGNEVVGRCMNHI
ncbi:hypothetical protein LXL04_000013 [Taraxacum kok-saghyz]